MTLTELSYYSRKLLPFIILFFFIFLAFFYAFRLLLSLGGQDEVPIYTNTVFGKIRKPQVKDASSSAGLNFSLDTIEGVPVTATGTARIFFLPPAAPRFGFREKIYLMAKNFGFNTEVVKHKLVDKEATFSDVFQTLKIDISNFNFSYKYNFEKNQNLFEGATIPTRDLAQNKAIDFLKLVGRYPDEFAKGKLNLIYLNYDSKSDYLTVVKRPQEANLIEIDFYRPDIEASPQAFPIVSPKFFNSQNYVVMLFHEKDTKFLRGQVNFFEKSVDQIGVYPLISADEAWEKLKAGQGMMIFTPGDRKKMTIKKIFLGYLDPDFYQDYLQPVYVFLGMDNFASYVPAVKDEYLAD